MNSKQVILIVITVLILSGVTLYLFVFQKPAPSATQQESKQTINSTTQSTSFDTNDNLNQALQDLGQIK